MFYIGIILLILIAVILIPKVKYNHSIQQQNDCLKKENNALQQDADNLILKISELETQALTKEKELELLNWKTENIESTEQKLYEATKAKYKAKLENDYKDLTTEYTLRHEKLAESYVAAKSEATEEYLITLEELSNNFQQAFFDMSTQLKKEKQLLETEQAIVDAAIAARKREEFDEAQKNFYRLQISNLDLQDIEKLNEVALLLNSPEVLYKTIWKVYYEKPYSDLIGRVLGSKTISGIYKITNIKNGKSYVGQSTNVQERWKQHIKRGCGAESATRNKLYPAMLEEGVYNFYFELLEECPREKLDEQEDYWQKFFQTNTYGYSIK